MQNMKALQSKDTCKHDYVRLGKATLPAIRVGGEMFQMEHQMFQCSHCLDIKMVPVQGEPK